MSLVDAASDYIKRMLATSSAKGMKSLILDEQTSGIVGMVFSHSAILEQQVFLVERIDAKVAQNMSHLKAIIFVRPTSANLQLLKAMLKNPQYQEFHLFFSNIVPREMLRDLAESDAFELVKQVQEFYADYFAVSSFLFSLNIPDTFSLFGGSWSESDQNKFARICDGLLSLSLSLKTRPVIRYQGSSQLCERIAKKIDQVMSQQRDLFSFGTDASSRPLMIILDRREDPVTPLLMQWTYRAMLHEVIGIHNNRLSFKQADGMKEFVIGNDDHFFKSSEYLNFGDLGASVKKLVESYQVKTKSERQLETIEDMQRFVENYSEFMQESTTVSKHVALVSELSHQVELHRYMELSALQQTLACENSHANAAKQVMDAIKNPVLQDEDKLRMVCLYALRYEQDANDTSTFMSLLRERAQTEQFRLRVGIVNQLLRYAGSAVRTQDLFSNKDIFAKATNFIASGIKGVENIYTQHEALLKRTMDNIRKQRLKPNQFPICGASNPQADQPVRQCFLFIAGGATYEEAALVNEYNNSNRDIQFYLGGTTFHNSTSFLDDIFQGSNPSVVINIG